MSVDVFGPLYTMFMNVYEQKQRYLVTGTLWSPSGVSVESLCEHVYKLTLWEYQNYMFRPVLLISYNYMFRPVLFISYNYMFTPVLLISLLKYN